MIVMKNYEKLCSNKQSYIAQFLNVFSLALQDSLQAKVVAFD